MLSQQNLSRLSRQELNDMIAENPQIGVALYEKGLDFLAELKPHLLEELCLSTVKDHPEISLKILNSKLVYKLHEDVQAQLIGMSQIIEDDHDKTGKRIENVGARASKLNPLQKEYFLNLVSDSNPWCMLFGMPVDQNKKFDTIDALESIVTQAESFQMKK